MPHVDPIDRLLDAALPHVAFDGWSDTTFAAAAQDAGMELPAARAICPRGAVGLALAYHARGDAQMLAAAEAMDMGTLRFRDKIAAMVRARLEASRDKELVRRGSALFALPHHAGDGAKAIWGTADAIWNALGDSSEDVNWYTKRATLSAVYSATVLYWLGDTSEDNSETWAFLDRRIDNVMQIEKAKAQVRESPVLSRLMAGPNWLLSHVKAPSASAPRDLPGRWTLPPR
ncbi:MAG: COQ9 family protein [Sulfitobacter sp.]